ncbi:ArsR/SmtB family transcription factor [Brachybacterium sp. GCM10030268]|uniref:ArsR/SmtB family transcription factor n=1 Tax=Brachybacterium sp. GCM10030268 TaxID=3273382 RepID=UPI00361E0BCA
MDDEGSTGEFAARLRHLEQRIAKLEKDQAHSSTRPDPVADTRSAAAQSSDQATSTPEPAGNPWWALNALKAQVESPGAVVYTGTVDVGLGHLEYQWGRPTEFLLETDWAEHAETVAALGHPLRLAILRRLIDGERTVAQIVDELELGSTGIAYHHLSALQNAGWATSPRRGTWTIPASRVIPLLTIISAAEKG